MDIFGIGPLEFILILLVTLIIFGPNDMAKAGRTLGRALRRLATSPEWRIITQSAREFRHLPNRLVREAGIEDIKKDLPDLRRDADLDGLNKDLRSWEQDVSSWTKQVNQPPDDANPDAQPTIAPPRPVTGAKASPAAKAAPVKKQTFSWDEPDILPAEDDNT
jgi:hypothetical protein